MLHREHTHNNVSVDALKCGKTCDKPIGTGDLAFLLEETARKILPEAVLTCCAAAKAMRDYSLIRATNHGLLLNAAHAPPVVPTPALHAASHQ